jgi:uncharacterized coiled-coil protein SlyX
MMHELDELKASIARLEKHVEAQDLEVYRQQRLIEGLQKKTKKLEEQIESFEQSDVGSSMPADEKPPHY